MTDDASGGPLREGVAIMVRTRLTILSRSKVGDRDGMSSRRVPHNLLNKSLVPGYHACLKEHRSTVLVSGPPLIRRYLPRAETGHAMLAPFRPWKEPKRTKIKEVDDLCETRVTSSSWHGGNISHVSSSDDS